MARLMPIVEENYPDEVQLTKTVSIYKLSQSCVFLQHRLKLKKNEKLFQDAR
jgi:hypothetical protein